VPKVSQQHKDARRAQILDAARRCFVRDGFHRASMQDILDEAGLSAGAVYRYFASKSDMIVAIATQNLEDMVGVLRGAVAHCDGTRGLGAAIAELLTAAAGKHREHQLATVALMVWSEALRNPVLAERLTAAGASLRHDLALIVTEQQQRGALPCDVPAETLAGPVLAILPGFLLTLALWGPQAVDGFSDAVQALWPTPKPRGP
jgi:TetR/AcrR family transcriptional regulator, transcriptional repressor of aconitase